MMGCKVSGVRYRVSGIRYQHDIRFGLCNGQQKWDEAYALHPILTLVSKFLIQPSQFFLLFLLFLLSLHLTGHKCGQVADAVAVAPFVVVPADDFDEVAAQHERIFGAENGAVGVTFEVHADQLFLGVV